MKTIVILITYLALLPALASEYLCQNINFEFIDGSRNGQPQYIKLTLKEEGSEFDLELKLYDRHENPQSEQAKYIERKCEQTYSFQFDRKEQICHGVNSFGSIHYSQEAVAYLKYKVDRFTELPRESFLLNFYETQTHSNRFNAYIDTSTLRQFFCQVSL